MECLAQLRTETRSKLCGTEIYEQGFFYGVHSVVPFQVHTFTSIAAVWSPLGTGLTLEPSWKNWNCRRVPIFPTWPCFSYLPRTQKQLLEQHIAFLCRSWRLSLKHEEGETLHSATQTTQIASSIDPLWLLTFRLFFHEFDEVSSTSRSQGPIIQLHHSERPN